MEIVLATSNSHKLREFREMLQDLEVSIISLDSFSELPEIIEDGNTFAENALKKARTIAGHTGRITIADDSGLEVDHLGGRPGIHSARFAGEDADDEKNNEKLLRALDGAPKEKRGAQFTCFIALVDPDGQERVVQGSYRGIILTEYRGAHGFGYDPLFLDEVSDLTFSEMTGEQKNKVSHRSRAI
ncbi:MAG: XTP/dITP diphosphatase, partial [Desulfobacterales bacterium]|nr:XTP/dITP diphosphatase [Desulfobacterales bacterium]